jgi:hypothetical protein
MEESTFSEDKRNEGVKKRESWLNTGTMEVGATFGLNKLSLTGEERQNQLGLEQFCIQV